MANGSNLVLIEPDIFKVFPSSEAVNGALRILIKATQEVEASIMQKASQAQLARATRIHSPAQKASA